MYILQKSSNGVTVVPAEAKLMEKRRIFLTGEITPQVANDFVQKMLLLNAEGREPITVIINSPGGEINSGLLICDAIIGSKAAVRTVCAGRAYSMAAVILAVGEQGERYALSNSEMMLHGPRIGDMAGCDETAVESISTRLQKMKGILASVLVQATGRTLAEIGEALGGDHFFSVDDAAEFGLCDGICSLSEIMED